MILSISLFLVLSVTACNDKSKEANLNTDDQSNMQSMNMNKDSAMISMMKDPAMIDMMINECEKDTAMRRQICSKLMDYPRMREMMRSMLDSSKDRSAVPNSKLKMELHK